MARMSLHSTMAAFISMSLKDYQNALLLLRLIPHQVIDAKQNENNVIILMSGVC